MRTESYYEIPLPPGQVRYVHHEVRGNGTPVPLPVFGVTIVDFPLVQDNYRYLAGGLLPDRYLVGFFCYSTERDALEEEVWQPYLGDGTGIPIANLPTYGGAGAYEDAVASLIRSSEDYLNTLRSNRDNALRASDGNAVAYAEVARDYTSAVE